MANDIITLTFQVGEAWKGPYSATTEYGNAAVVQDSTGLSVYRSLKSGNVGHPLNDPEWWFKILDFSSIKAASDGVVALNVTIAGNEADRVLAENSRVLAEGGREDAEAERARKESVREGAESGRNQAEDDRVLAERGRVDAEATRVNSENVRVYNETNPTTGRQAKETARQTAEAERQLAETGRDQAEADRVLAEQGRVNAEAAREQGETNRNNQYAIAEGTKTGSVAGDGSRWGMFKGNEAERDAIVQEAIASITGKADKADLLDGSLVPALAGDLETFAERDDIPVDSVQSEEVRTTAGDESINASSGAKLMSIVPTADFTPTKLIISAFNLLRLQSNNGPAIAVGTGWAFPVPACSFGSYGNAERNNGILLTDNTGANLGYASSGRPTVRFLAGMTPPSAITDGVDMNASSDYYRDDADHGLRFYLPPAIGWMIVSGITWANTCAHMAWSRQYSHFVAPDALTDAGTIIDLTALGTMRYLASGNRSICDRADRTDATHMLLTTKIGRVASPSWSNIADEVAEGETQTYTHSVTVSGIKDGGLAAIEGQTQALVVEGTMVSYKDTNAAALSGALRYELATPTTASKAVATAVANLDDWGIDILIASAGTALINWQYSQAIADSLVALVATGFEAAMRVIAGLLVEQNARIAAIEEKIRTGFERLVVEELKVNAQLTNDGNDDHYEGTGAPAIISSRVGRRYFDTTGKEWYTATGNTAASQWKKDTNA